TRKPVEDHVQREDERLRHAVALVGALRRIALEQQVDNRADTVRALPKQAGVVLGLNLGEDIFARELRIGECAHIILLLPEPPVRYAGMYAVDSRSPSCPVKRASRWC